MRVMMIAEYLDDISNPSSYNSRFLTIADMLVSRGHRVEIVTTDFVHSLKQHVSGVREIRGCPAVTLQEPGYTKNISLRRFYSHYVLSQNLKKWLKNQQKPDVIYCAVPSLDFAWEAARFARKQQIKFVLDIQDLWPEAFEMVLRIPLLSDILFAPLRWRADAIYRSADCLIAVSATYLRRATAVNRISQKNETVFLGTDLDDFDRYAKEPFPISKGEGEFWLGYAGSLSRSYDLITVLDALELIRKDGGYQNLKLLVMGDGPKRAEFEAYAEKKKLPVIFTGKLPYPTMAAGLAQCDAAVNPIRKDSAGSILNKHGDYAAAGLPVINTQESREYRDLVEEHSMGINCGCENAADVARAIACLMDSEELRHAMGEGARVCAQDRFDRAATYLRILEAIAY